MYRTIRKAFAMVAVSMATLAGSAAMAQAAPGDGYFSALAAKDKAAKADTPEYKQAAALEKARGKFADLEAYPLHYKSKEDIEKAEKYIIKKLKEAKAGYASLDGSKSSTEEQMRQRLYNAAGRARVLLDPELRAQYANLATMPLAQVGKDADGMSLSVVTKVEARLAKVTIPLPKYPRLQETDMEIVVKTPTGKYVPAPK